MEHAETVLNIIKHTVMAKDVVQQINLAWIVMTDKSYHNQEFVKIVQTMKDSKVLDQHVDLINVMKDRDW